MVIFERWMAHPSEGEIVPHPLALVAGDVLREVASHGDVPTQFLEKMTVVLCGNMSFSLSLMRYVVMQFVNMFVIPSLDVGVSGMEV